MKKLLINFLFLITALWADVKSTTSLDNIYQHAFGAIADCQYCNKEGTGIRKYSLSKDKLSDCVESFNKLNLKYVVHLGDFIDQGFENFDVLNPIMNTLSMPSYHVLGNHDFQVEDHLKKDVPKKMGLTNKYYDYTVKGWRYIVLDGNDVSFHAYPKDSPAWRKASEYYIQHKIQSPKWNGAVGKEQLSWLKKTLDLAEEKKEKVILFCHFPVHPPNKHNLWNAEEIIKTIEPYSCVKAYINGHNHHGNYALKNGIHYVTLKGMVDTKKTSYAVIKVDENTIKVEGYGREENRTLLNKK
jgi:predicted phosphodiesterase